MSEPLNRESTDSEEQPALCPKCNKPLAIDLKFTVSSWFQTDPGSGLSRWQQCCKCGMLGEQDDDLPFRQEVQAAAQEEEKSLSQPVMQILYSVSPQPQSTEQLDPATSVTPQQTPTAPPAPAGEKPAAVSPWALGYDSQSNHVVDSALESETAGSSDESDLVAEAPTVEDRPEKETTAASSSVVGSPAAVLGDASKEPTIAKHTFLPAQVGPVYLPQEVKVNIPDPNISQSYLIGGRYEVDSVIGKGTFGPTYRARDGATGKMMCLKLVSTPISRHRRIIKRIVQEVEKAKTLNHPHIVAIYDSAMDKSGRPFYVMDLIENGSLKKAIKEEGFLDVPEVLDIFLDVCEALSYAHQQGMLHRDLKPANILLSGELGQRRAKVSDFGVIRALPSVGSEAQEMTQSTDVFADPSCMSPEQCLGRRLDVRSDIYSLGCSMYEAIVGKRVFTGPNPLSIVVQHFKLAPRPFDTVMYNCDVHEDVEAVVMRMLDKAPENRYQEISQVIEDLRLLRAHKKPNFAYQKKKSQKGLLPFSNKEEQNDAERLFDMVLQSQKPWDREDWRDAKPQIEADINKLVKKADPNARRQRMKVVRPPENNHGTDEDYNASPAENTNIPAQTTQAPKGDKRWARESQNAPTAENKIFMPAPIASSNRTAAPPKQLERVYELTETPEYEEVALFEDTNSRAIITADQAKREIPDYLLEIAQAPYAFFEYWTPLKIAAVALLVAAIFMTLWLVIR